MMAATRHFIYRGGGRNVIPRDATHVSIDESVTVIPTGLFFGHPNIVELICHAGVKRIEEFAFYECPCLKRLVIPGVEIVEEGAFQLCEAVTDIECPKLERIGFAAFFRCKSLSSINLPSAKVVQGDAFDDCKAMTDVKFGTDLATIWAEAFSNCRSLGRITIPLKNDLLSHDDTFQFCDNLKRVDLVEGEELHDTIDALLLEEWRNDMNEEVESISQILPNASAGYYYDDEDADYVGDKARVIREWVARVLRKVIRYKAEHCHILDEAAATLGLVLPADIVTSNVLPFLELPSHTFEGEDEEEEEEEEEGSSNRGNEGESYFTSEGDEDFGDEEGEEEEEKDDDDEDDDDEEGEKEDGDNNDECEEQDDADMAVVRKRRKTNHVDEEVR